MVAKKSNKIILCLFIAFAFLLSLFFGGINISSADATSEQKNPFFQVQVLNENDAEVAPIRQEIYNHSSVGSAKAYVFKAKNSAKFKFKFDFDDVAMQNVIETPVPDANYYNLRIQIEYLQGYTSSYFTLADDSPISEVAVNNTMKTSTHQDNGWKVLDSWAPTWNIHSHATAEDGKSIHGWGIYRFKMTLGENVTAYSDYFVLEPVTEILNAPEIRKLDKGFNQYEFSVNQAGDYQYIDENQLTWYVYGIEKGGANKWALLDEDLLTDTFINLECNKALHASVPRTGFTFVLEKPTIEGEWFVWCEYTPAGVNTMPRKSNDASFYVGTRENVFPYWTLAIGGAVLSIVICIIIASVKAKREKIY